MDDFTSQIEEFNTRFTNKRPSPSSLNTSVQPEACHGSAPTSYFISGLENGSLTGSIMPSSASSLQLAKDAQLVEEISNISRGQRQMIHQLDNLGNFLRESTEERCKPAKLSKNTDTVYSDFVGVSLIATLAIGGLGILFFKVGLTRY